MYFARVVPAEKAVSVAHSSVEEENTKPYIEFEDGTSTVASGLAEVGRPLKARIPVPIPPPFAPSLHISCAFAPIAAICTVP